MTKKLAETAKCKACADKKVSKFKPPITQMHDEPESSKYKFFEPSFKSQKDVKNLEKMELEKCEKIKEKELKLKEKYYLIKMYMIIQKTAVLFSKNPMDTSKFKNSRPILFFLCRDFSESQRNAKRIGKISNQIEKSRRSIKKPK